MVSELTTLRQMTLTPNLPFEVKPLTDITDKLPRDKTRRWPKRKVTRRIIVHHSAVEGSILGHANHHVYTKKRIAICYHTVIKGDEAFQTNDWADAIDHALHNNEDTISVCVDGDFTKRELTPGERNALYAVILTYMALFNVEVDLVLGHGEVRPTACPGFDMGRVREDLKALQTKMIGAAEIAASKVIMSNRDKIQKMLNRAAELVNIYNDKNHPYSAEAERKLLVIDEAITEKGFYR